MLVSQLYKIKLLEKVKTKYVLYLSDNFILYNCDTNKINDILSWLDTNNYDSVQLHIQPNDLPNISISKDINVFEIKDSNYPFSFLPSIWKNQSILKAYESIPHASYREVEGSLMEYMNKNCRVFRLKDVDQEKVKSWDSEMENWFINLHLLHGRKWVIPTPLKGLYMNILQEYNIDTNTLGTVDR